MEIKKQIIVAKQSRSAICKIKFLMSIWHLKISFIHFHSGHDLNYWFSCFVSQQIGFGYSIVKDSTLWAEGGQNKRVSGHMLLTIKSRCQNICLNEKRPKLTQEMSGTMFFKAQYKFFLEFLKKNGFAISVALKMTIQKYFFVKKICQKNLPTKLVKKIYEKINWKSTFFYKKI